MKKYMVIGGEYQSTQFADLHPDTFQEHGPFHQYNEAQSCWQSLSMQHIDNALVRFQIKIIDDNERFWVVGGVYENTRFEKLVPNQLAVESGPFPSWEEAEKHWRSVSMQYVDDALARFRIEMR